MGTPEFSVPSLERLIIDGHDVAAVFTQPDKPAGRGKHLHAPPIKTLALGHCIAVHQPLKIKTNQEACAIFEGISPDACVVVAYGKILPAWMLAIPRFGCINVHASLLPRYRGAAPINWAIANGERETGVTIMQMDVGMDTGPMLSRRSIQIGDEDTAPELSARLAQVGADLLSETLPRVELGEVAPETQDESQASYAPMLKRENGAIDWTLNASEIANRVRAFQPWPGTHTGFRGGRLIIWRGRQAPKSASSNAIAFAPQPGTILNIDDSGITIVCNGSTALLIQEVQLEGKRRVSAREFANGARLEAGERIDQE
ncbi:MAG TPA: methionyl-tRNA formyltransferase [Blastocatellia bacterium]|nr:methionyl-tRNA formyltransferase [Blastocatellia bacterium]